MGTIQTGQCFIVRSPDPLKFDGLTFRSDLIEDGHFLRRVGSEIVGAITQGLPTRPFVWSADGIVEYNTIQDAIYYAPEIVDRHPVVVLPPGEYDETIEVSRNVILAAAIPSTVRIDTVTSITGIVYGIRFNGNHISVDNAALSNCIVGGSAYFSFSDNGRLIVDHCTINVDVGPVFLGVSIAALDILCSNISGQSTIFDIEYGPVTMIGSRIQCLALGDCPQLSMLSSIVIEL